MAIFSSPQFLNFSTILFLFGFLHFTVEAQIPSTQTFKFINQGELGAQLAEYGANYRVITSALHTLATFPYQLCFYNTTPNAYVLAISAGTPSDQKLMRWVWDANRNDPVREKATLSFGQDGNLVLADADGRLVWQTRTANKGVTGVKLLPNGNLVLHNKNNRFIWQSFDYPTDTLLISQSVRNKLVSRASDAVSVDGKYSFVLENTGFNMYLSYSGQIIRYGGWRGHELGSIATFDVLPVSDKDNAFQLVVTIKENATARSGYNLYLREIDYNAKHSYFRLGSDGNLKAYTYYEKERRWEESFAYFSGYYVRECELPFKCGSYGLCHRGVCEACPTPNGLVGWSNSCAPPKLPECKGNALVNYYKIAGVEHFLNQLNDDGDGVQNIEECRARCSKDCKCLAFFFKEETNRCFLAPLLGTLIKVRDVNSSVGYIKY